MASENQDKNGEMEPLAFIPIPSHMTEVDPIDPTFPRASEVTFRLVRPETLRATAPGFNLRRFCRDIISNFNAYAATPGTTDLEMEGRAIGLLAKAKEDFHRLCPSALHLFSAWAFRNARSIDAAKTGADVFLRLMTWVNPFPESPDDLDDLLDICDSLGCKYTIVMLAFGIYPGFRPHSDRKKILDKLGVVAQAVQNVPTSYLARNKFIDRALHFSASLRTMHIASQHVDLRSPRILFPSPTEVSVSLQWCMDLLPYETGPIVYQVETPDEPSEQAFNGGPSYGDPSNEELEDQQAGASQSDPDMPVHTERRPPVRTRRAHRARSNAASRGSSPADEPVPEKGASSPPGASSSSSSSTLKRPSDQDQEAPTAKRQNVGVQQSLADPTSRDPSSGQTLTAQHIPEAPHNTGSLQPFHVGHAAPQQSMRCMTPMELMTQENAVHDQFIDFTTRFHDNLNLNGLNVLQYIVIQHGLLVEQMRLQTQPEGQDRVALAAEAAGPVPSQVVQTQPRATAMAPSTMPASDLSHAQQSQEAQSQAPLRGQQTRSLHMPSPSSMGQGQGQERGSGRPPMISQYHGGQGAGKGKLGHHEHKNKSSHCFYLHRYINPSKCPVYRMYCNKKTTNGLQQRCSQQQRGSAQCGNCLTQDQASQVAAYRARLHDRMQEQVRMIPVSLPPQPSTAGGQEQGAGTEVQSQAPQQQPDNLDYFNMQTQIPALRPYTFLAEGIPPRASYTYAVRSGPSESAADGEQQDTGRDRTPPPAYQPPANATRASHFGILADQSYMNAESSDSEDEEEDSSGSSDEESSESDGSESGSEDSSDEDENTSEEKGESAGNDQVRRSPKLSTRGQ